MAQSEIPASFESLLEYVRDERGFDFTGYKRPTLMRRIAKRMEAVHLDDYDAYRRYLAENPAEYVELFNTILINVTGFFRDQLTWDYVRDELVPRILDEDAALEQIRIWSTGCATGEEAYTLAMIFAEAMGEEAFRQRVKIYATDVDEDALASGRRAAYTARDLEPVPAELRDKYFDHRKDHFVFRAEIRRAVIFGRHDLLQDPPISRVDLLVSRNTLMYFNGEAQERILRGFHFALRDTGFLLLGKAETLAQRSGLFDAVVLKQRVFSRVARSALPARLRQPAPRVEERPLAELASDVLMRQAGFEAAPVAQVVVDRDGNLALANLLARRNFGLGQRDIGRPIRELELSFRPVELRSRIEQAYADRHAVSVHGIEWQDGEDIRFVDVQVVPLVSATGDLVGVGVTFADVTRYRRMEEVLEDSKRELEATGEQLHSTIEELETTNEELQSMNEQLETTNDELHSTNEELETMNEELQSTNEELQTINDELRERTGALDEANALLEAVLSGARGAVVVVDADFAIQAWNDAAQELWGVGREETVGTHLMNLDIGLPVEQLRNPIRAALVEAEPQVVVVPAHDRRGRELVCSIAVTPFRNGGEPRGAILIMRPEESRVT